MDQLIGQRQIADGIIILVSVEVVTIATEGLTQSVRVVKHGCYTVKAETIELELL